MRAWLLAFATLLATSTPARADLVERPALQISVEPLVVQFTVAPGARASTPVTIRNVGSETAYVTVVPIDWHTTVDGDVRTQPARGTNASSLDTLLAMSAHEFTLAAGEVRKLTLSLAMPPELGATATSDRWGGYLVRATPASMGKTAAFGVGANVLAYETTGTPRRHLRVDDLVVNQHDRGAVDVIARFANDGANYVRPQIRVRIARAGRIVRSLDDSTPAIFSGAKRRYRRTFDGLEAGHYDLEIASEYGGTTLVDATTAFDIK